MAYGSSPYEIGRSLFHVVDAAPLKALLYMWRKKNAQFLLQNKIQYQLNVNYNLLMHY